ncbi:MAG: UDP-N-acetylglucosamine 2-epimerase (non-hydrolyzing) [Crocinitomicaceae bacterium]|nr:UDP-N-acetylglucosamine 2-epimerase (non-hydrolyzing) [Crocinitomicaceae bacterium]
MKILTIVGARPQFVKAAALSRALKKHNSIEEIIVHTGQHFDKNMSDIFFKEMEIPKPKYNLDINSISHGAMTGRMLEKIEELILLENPNLILVYGDTNSTLAGALAAKKLHVKVAHIEAGLRSFNIKMPEEINRILTDRISDYLFCPTENAITNLNNEGYSNKEFKIIKCGDVMQDAAYYYAESSSEKSTIISKLKVSNFILCTLHRAENTDDPNRLEEIISALNNINKETPIILPLHPRTKNKISDLNIELNFKTIDPVGYFDMIELLKKCALVITDSGGLQKEAYFFKKNCVTMRDQTEWVELLENKVNIIVGADENKIINGVKEMLSRKSDFEIDLYGNGKACDIIAEELIKNT